MIYFSLTSPEKATSNSDCSWISFQ